MPQWLETIVTLGGGAVLLRIADLIGQYFDNKSGTERKKTPDETELSRLLLDHNQTRYESLVRELEGVKVRVEELMGKVRDLEIENLHLRHLCGLGPDCEIPATRRQLKNMKEKGEITKPAEPQFESVEDEV